MTHGNARLTVHGRRLIVQRSRRLETGAHRRSNGSLSSLREAVDRPLPCRGRRQTAGPVVETALHAHAHKQRSRASGDQLARPRSDRKGRDRPPTRSLRPHSLTILARHHIPHLSRLDPITGNIIRASKTTAVRYERDRPGELVHMDVKKLGRIPTPASHTPKSSETRRAPPAPLSWNEPSPTSPNTASPASNGSSPTTPGPTDSHSGKSAQLTVSDRGSSSRTARGRTAKPNASTARCKPNGPTGRSSPRTTPAPPHSHPGSSTTTSPATTVRSEATPRSADCYQRDGRVHLGSGKLALRHDQVSSLWARDRLQS